MNTEEQQRDDQLSGLLADSSTDWYSYIRDDAIKEALEKARAEILALTSDVVLYASVDFNGAPTEATGPHDVSFKMWAFTSISVVHVEKVAGELRPVAELLSHARLERLRLLNVAVPGAGGKYELEITFPQGTITAAFKPKERERFETLLASLVAEF